MYLTILYFRYHDSFATSCPCPAVRKEIIPNATPDKYILEPFPKRELGSVYGSRALYGHAATLAHVCAV